MCAIFNCSRYIESLIFECDTSQNLKVLIVKENACKVLLAIFESDRLNIPVEIVDFAIYSCTKILCKQVLSNQVYLQLPLAQLLMKIYDRRRVEISQRLENASPENSILKKGS